MKKEIEGETSRGRAEWKRREEGSQAGSEGVGLVVTVKKVVRSSSKYNTLGKIACEMFIATSLGEDVLQ